MNDALRTDVFVRFEPETIACACIYLSARALQIALPNKPHWFLVFGATEEEIREVCIGTLRLYSREKPNYERLESEVEKRKLCLDEARLKAKGLNPNSTPALQGGGGFSPASKPCSPREVKAEEKSAVTKQLKELDDRQPSSKSPINGMRKEESKAFQNGQSHNQSESRSRSQSRSPHRRRRSRSGTYSSHSSPSPAPLPAKHRSHRSPLLPHLRAEHGHQSRHGNKRRRSRSRSRSRSASRERGHEREREYAKRKPHERSTSDHHWEQRERSHEHSQRSKHHSRSHSGHGHSRHRR